MSLPYLNGMRVAEVQRAYEQNNRARSEGEGFVVEAVVALGVGGGDVAVG